MSGALATPTFTAVVVTRDRPALLGDALRSLAAQTLPPLEVRVGDGGETAVARSALPPGLPGLTVIRTGVGAAGEARNRAARGAPGDVLAFLDDDDLWLPGHLEELAAAFADSAVQLAYSDCAVIRERVEEGGPRVELARRTIARDWDPSMMRHNDYIPPSALAVRTTLFDRLGGFDAAFRSSEDWDFLLRAAAVTTPRRVPGATVQVRLRGSGNASADFGEERIACLRRLERRHGLPPLVPRTFWEVAEALERAEGR
jgi:glycosyltransferase involved in cell wall biosynthesis